MKLPLFISAKPVVGLKSTKVLVGKGMWGIGCSDEKINFNLWINDIPHPYSHDCIVVVEEPTAQIYLEVIQAGTSNIDVFIYSVEKENV